MVEWLGWLFEAASSLAPLLATIGVLAVFLRVFQRQWRWAALWSLLSVGFGLLWFVGIGDALPLRGDRAPVLTVVTANLYGYNAKFDAVFDWARMSNADLLVFQEVTSAWGHALDPLNQSYLSTASTTGIRVYSRHPISNRETIALIQGGSDALQFDVQVPGGPITVVAAHLVSPTTAENLAIRNRQLGALARHMRDLEGEAILVGDLNTAVTTLNFAALLDQGRLSHPQTPVFFGTWPTFVPLGLFQIDHVLVRGGLGYSAVGTEEVPGSDHYALRVEIVRTAE